MSINLVNTTIHRIGCRIDTVNRSVKLNLVSNPSSLKLIVKTGNSSNVVLNEITAIAGEIIPSHTPLVLIANELFKINNLDPLHQFAFVGFSKTSAVIGQDLQVETYKISMNNWGLTQNQQYLAGENGTLVSTVNSGFKKVIGWAEDANTLLIIKDYTSINI